MMSTDSGRFTLSLNINEEETNQSCEVCNGERSAELTVIFHTELLSVADADGEEWQWEIFEEQYRHIADDIRWQLSKRGFGKPVCIECQKDLFVPGRDHYSSD